MWLSAFKWMFLIIGTTIGAGYASGRELWEFFGAESTLAIFLFVCLFYICCYTVMKISYEKKTENYKSVLTELMGTKLANVYDGMIILYLFSMTMIMVAGGGATLQAIKIPYWHSVFIFCVLLVLLFIKGINGMTTVNAFLTPFLIIFLIGVIIYFQWTSNIDFTIDFTKQSNWPSAFTFTALNMLSLIAVLAAIGRQVKAKGEIIIACLGSAIILGVTSFLYNESLLLISNEVMVYEIPLFAIMKNYPIPMMIAMTIILWSAIFTTAASGILGLCTRLYQYIKLPYWLLTMLLLILMVPLTNIGFSKLVSILYPIYGILNLYVLAAILLYPIMHRFDDKTVK